MGEVLGIAQGALASTPTIEMYGNLHLHWTSGSKTPTQIVMLRVQLRILAEICLRLICKASGFAYVTYDNDNVTMPLIFHA